METVAGTVISGLTNYFLSLTSPLFKKSCLNFTAFAYSLFCYKSMPQYIALMKLIFVSEQKISSKIFRQEKAKFRSNSFSKNRKE